MSDSHFDHILPPITNTHHKHSPHKKKWLFFDLVLLCVIIFTTVLTYKWYLMTSSVKEDKKEETPPTASTPAQAPRATLDPGKIILCTQDVKQCEDGSYVIRVAPSCEFEKCPELKACGGIMGETGSMKCPSGYYCKYPNTPGAADESGVCVKK